jgi:hypothetical protein
LLRVVCEYPEHAGFEDHLVRMTKAIEAFMPNRVVAAPEPVGRSGKAAGGAV